MIMIRKRLFLKHKQNLNKNVEAYIVHREEIHPVHQLQYGSKLHTQLGRSERQLLMQQIFMAKKLEPLKEKLNRKKELDYGKENENESDNCNSGIIHRFNDIYDDSEES